MDQQRLVIQLSCGVVSLWHATWQAQCAATWLRQQGGLTMGVHV